MSSRIRFSSPRGSIASSFQPMSSVSSMERFVSKPCETYSFSKASANAAYFLSTSVSAASLLPLILALLLSSRAPGVQARRIVPLCAVVLAVTALLMPLSSQTVPELETLALRVQRMIDVSESFQFM